MTAIAIAAGGGGDAITAAALAAARPDMQIAAIMTWSWDRLMVDPTPGPRAVADFSGLADLGGVWEVRADARLRGDGRSTLPRLARHVRLPILLADATAGVVGLAAHMRCATTAFGAGRLVVVDVGGDILATGDEAGLRSPLADSVALAAAVRTGLPVQVLVTGIGLDGELTSAEAADRLATLEAKPFGRLVASDFAALQEVWMWHPSEANGLLAAAAAGFRGRVGTQRGVIVEVGDASVDVHDVPADALAKSTLARAVADTATFDEIERVLRKRRGYSDVDIERQRLTNRPPTRTPTVETVAMIDGYVADADRRGLDALTLRRVSELVGATDTRSAEALREILRQHRPRNFRPPLYECRLPRPSA
ncbi:DUF1152 domain-containing protein [Nocardia sp. NPDC004068]|uniref:DUF1152 domain-containing protein n=1 Tax=Nocardia sp. NPDC004068 TaxID=3364303 RepID=UPI0036BA6D8B